MVLLYVQHFSICNCNTSKTVTHVAVILLTFFLHFNSTFTHYTSFKPATFQQNGTLSSVLAVMPILVFSCYSLLVVWAILSLVTATLHALLVTLLHFTTTHYSLPNIESCNVCFIKTFCHREIRMSYLTKLSTAKIQKHRLQIN
jgi:heme/copper-type cytochrome/quinol oxidase subunit 2